MKAEILKSVIKNNKVIVILKNEFDNLHIAIWNGTNVDAIKTIHLPLNFKMTASYGNNINNKFLTEKFLEIVKKSNMETYLAIK